MSPLYFKILLLFLPVLLYMQLISPLYSGGGQIYIPDTNIKASKELSVQYDGAISQAESLIKDINSLRGQYDTFDENTKKVLNIMIPSSINEVLLTDELAEFFNASGLTIESFSVTKGASQTYPELGAYDLSVIVTGSYDDFLKIIKFIQTSLRLYEIQSIAFDAPNKDTGISKMTVSFKTYYIK